MQAEILTTYNRQLLATRETSINNVAYQQLTGSVQAQ